MRKTVVSCDVCKTARIDTSSPDYSKVDVVSGPGPHHARSFDLCADCTPKLFALFYPKGRPPA